YSCFHPCTRHHCPVRLLLIERCGPYIDATGTQFQSRCNVVDTGATCNEDPSLPLCTCTPPYMGPTCSLLVTMYERVKAWLGAEVTDKLMEIIRTAQKTPAALV
ncbi:hypothetical protein PMAYCL1PPCAC_32686, partial [Pristionchus mayeri]